MALLTVTLAAALLNPGNPLSPLHHRQGANVQFANEADQSSPRQTANAKAGNSDRPGSGATGSTGIEGDRPTVTYPQPKVQDRDCKRFNGLAVIRLTERPNPLCVALSVNDRIRFENRTGHEISIVSTALNEPIQAGSDFEVSASDFGPGETAFWSPGQPQLSGLVRVR